MKTPDISQTYESFAAVYDTFMDNVPYAKWCGRYEEILKENGMETGLMLDLGCGTGTMALYFSQKGYDLIGIDSSIDMLNIAQEKSKNEQILYLNQDMREFELYGTVRAVYCSCDSINYILSLEEITRIFSLVNNYLDPGGLFLFDFNTDYKYRELIGDQVIAEDREDMSFIWDNYYDQENQVNECALSLFVREEDGRYQKYQEFHCQKGYCLEQMKEALRQAGLLFLFAEDGEEGGPVRHGSGRILVAAKEYKKQEQRKGI